ncbi:MAG: hypothetical protein ABIH82_02845 [Candidatus Woesearchaeota archaeon]|nr:hypothetical protein [Nanoarchaeota archaeon]MBU1623031.1 hypothetical protein [Nanoarchaeota archaeon]MBU1973883.1 hypothetical protein [Nanoarchaeota archaeon]
MNVKLWGEDTRKKQRVTIRLDSYLLNLLQQKSNQNDITVSDTIRDLLSESLNQENSA